MWCILLLEKMKGFCLSFVRTWKIRSFRHMLNDSSRFRERNEWRTVSFLTSRDVWFAQTKSREEFFSPCCCRKLTYENKFPVMEELRSKACEYWWSRRVNAVMYVWLDLLYFKMAWFRFVIRNLWSKFHSHVFVESPQEHLWSSPILGGFDLVVCTSLLHSCMVKDVVPTAKMYSKACLVGRHCGLQLQSLGFWTMSAVVQS